jgi:erythromycin esterase-like protein
MAGRARAVVWAHNSHLGDARATEMGDGGELNLGQLVRQKHGRDATADRLQHAHRHRDRGAQTGTNPAQRKRVRPSLAGSYERLFTTPA